MTLNICGIFKKDKQTKLTIKRIYIYT